MGGPGARAPSTQFGWDKIARITVDVYQRAIDGRG